MCDRIMKFETELVISSNLYENEIRVSKEIIYAKNLRNVTKSHFKFRNKYSNQNCASKVWTQNYGNTVHFVENSKKPQFYLKLSLK